MTDTQQLSHTKDEDTLVIDAEYLKRGIVEGMKGVFTPYLSIYEAITGKEHTLVTRDHKTGRFVGKRRERRQARKLRGARG